MLATLVVAVLLAMQYVPAGSVCSWSDISRRNAAELVPEFFKYADAVVHGQVLSRQVNENGVETAQVAVLHSFKGTASSLQLRGYPGHCGYSFTVGEDRIYFIKAGVVGSAGSKRVSPWLLAALNGVGRAK